MKFWFKGKVAWFLCDVLGAHRLTPTRNLMVGGQVVASEEVCQRCGAKFVDGAPDALAQVDARDAMDQARMARERCICGHIFSEHERDNVSVCLAEGCSCPLYRPQGHANKNTTPRRRA